MAKNFREPETKMSPAARARSDAKTQKMIEEMALNELRQAMGITQERLAKALGIMEYLRQIHREAMRDFFATDGELDIHEAKRQAGAIRAFFYDSIDETPRPGETEETCRTRLVPLQNFFARTGALSGVHIRLGTVTGKRRRQKEVDILLATDMLTHGFNGNMKTAVLLSGDLGRVQLAPQ